MLLQAAGVLGLHVHNLVELEYEPGAEVAVEEIVLDVQRKSKNARPIYVHVSIKFRDSFSVIQTSGSQTFLYHFPLTVFYTSSLPLSPQYKMTQVQTNLLQFQNQYSVYNHQQINK